MLRFLWLRRFGGARFSEAKLWSFMCAVGFIVSTWFRRFTGFGEQLGSIFTVFLLFLTPFGCHLGSILASFWHLFEPWLPFWLHFEPWRPLGVVPWPTGTDLGGLWGDFGAIFGRPGASASGFGVILGRLLAPFSMKSWTNVTRNTAPCFFVTFSRESFFFVFSMF